MARVGLELRGAESQRETTGFWRNVGVESAWVRVRFSLIASASAMLVWEKGRAGRGARQIGKREASATKMEVCPGDRSVGVRAAEMAWSVSWPVGEAMERRSLRWMVLVGAGGEEGRWGREKEVPAGRARRRA